MHNHLFAALYRKVPENLVAVGGHYDDTSLKHLILIRINSGREEANNTR